MYDNKYKYIYTYKHKYRQRDSQSQADRQTARQTDGQAYKWWTDRQTDGQIQATQIKSVGKGKRAV